MTKDLNQLSIPKRAQYNQIQREAIALLGNISKFYNSEVELLIKHLYKQGYTVQKVANILGVTKQAISLRFPKEKYENA